MIDALLDSEWGFIVFVAGCIAAVFLLAAGLFAVIMPFAYLGDRASCRAYGEQTGRDTRFVHLVDVVVPLSWDCLVRTADGRWISRSQLRSVDKS